MKENRDIIYVRMPNRLNWITTFCDMTTILLCFFVLIISMSSMENKALQKYFGYFSSIVGPLDFPLEHELKVSPSAAKPVPLVVYKNAESLNRYLMLSLSKRTIKALPEHHATPFEVQETSRGFSIRVPGDVLFDKGSPVIRRDALAILMAIAEFIKDTGSTISIEGNTDSLGSEETNWKLSLKRAVSVLEYFEYREGMSPSQFCVVGYGSMRPITGNDTEEGRAKNRRVEIILLKGRL
jgi:chemotaxis protein MotB